ncbi:MAG: metallopeptidase family protein [SAR202 cluster bacterium]|nr:metallopeptidase family protein [SAR202 cluster bacterium]
MLRLKRHEFVDMVLRCYEDLPPQIMDYLENVDVVVEDWPAGDVLDSQQMESRHDLLGSYTGVSRLERGGELPMLPDKITIYQRPLESICATLEDLEREVRKTLLHEVGHYLGLDEEALHRLGYE